jgi:hypothetical protein
MEVSMADKITRDMSEAPRDASKMGSNSHTGFYALLVVVAAVLLGLAIYTGSETATAPGTPPATTTN